MMKWGGYWLGSRSGPMTGQWQEPRPDSFWGILLALREVLASRRGNLSTAGSGWQAFQRSRPTGESDQRLQSVPTATSMCVFRRIKCEEGKCVSNNIQRKTGIEMYTGCGKHFLGSRTESRGIRMELAGSEKVENNGWHPAGTPSCWASWTCQWLWEGAF